MIKNEKQYKISKAQLQLLQKALLAVPATAENVHPILLDAQREAIQSQYQDLSEDVDAYEMLRDGNYNQIAIDSFDMLPQGLIKARIAKGLSQKELAERLGLKEQQIQRYESTDYASASFERLKQIIVALDIKVTKDIFLSDTHFDAATMFKNFLKVGLSKDFIVKKLLPFDLSTKVENFDRLQTNEAETTIRTVGNMLAKMFNLSTESLFSSGSFSLNLANLNPVRYKKAGNANEVKVGAYTVYAHMIALNVMHCLKTPNQSPIPDDPEVVRNAIISKYGKIGFTSTVKYMWDLGIPVIALDDPGAFHGACWRVNGFNIIVLKQRLMSEARWTFDAIHEFCHAGQYPEQLSLDVIESDGFSKEVLANEDEVEANYFAAEVILGANADIIANACVTTANGKVENLKNVVPTIAAKYKVDPGALASHLSFRLAKEKGINWWGTANNLQSAGFSPWDTCRMQILEKCDFNKLNEFDRELVIRAIM